jgi:predicted nucleic acid-binding protein
MTFDQLPANSAVFLDANTFVYAILNHPAYGGKCVTLLDRIERHEVQGFTSSHVVSDTVHRVMTLEACDRFGWPAQGIANRLRRHPGEGQQLLIPRRAVDEIQLAMVTVLPVTFQQVSQAVDLTRLHGLLSGDALIVAVMRDSGLTQLASLDTDFDRVPGLVRYPPV